MIHARATRNSPQNYPFWIFDWFDALDPPFSTVTTQWFVNMLRKCWTASLLRCLLSKFDGHSPGLFHYKWATASWSMLCYALSLFIRFQWLATHECANCPAVSSRIYLKIFTLESLHFNSFHLYLSNSNSFRAKMVNTFASLPQTGSFTKWLLIFVLTHQHKTRREIRRKQCERLKFRLERWKLLD